MCQDDVVKRLNAEGGLRPKCERRFGCCVINQVPTDAKPRSDEFLHSSSTNLTTAGLALC